MKKLVLTLIATAAIVGCSSSPKQSAANSEPIADQRLETTFTRNSVKLEWSCKWGSGFSEKTCIKGNIVAIEATGYAPSYGNSEVNRETAFGVAHDVALDKLVRFIKQDLTSSRVTNTLTKNVEKAEDTFNKTGKRGTASVSEEDSDTGSAATGTTTNSNRNNLNDTVRSVVETIKSKSSGIVRGARTIDERVVDKQTVSVTVRWSADVSEESKRLGSYFR